MRPHGQGVVRLRDVTTYALAAIVLVWLWYVMKRREE